MLKIFLIHILLVFNVVQAQLDAFPLPQMNRLAPKPTVPPELRSFFELDGHARELLDSLMGPRPGGFFPEKTYEISEPVRTQSGPAPPPTGLGAIEKTLESFLSGPPAAPAGGGGSQFQFPPGFNQGFSLLNGDKPVTAFQNDKPTVRRHPEAVSFKRYVFLQHLKGQATSVQRFERGFKLI